MGERDGRKIPGGEDLVKAGKTLCRRIFAFAPTADRSLEGERPFSWLRRSARASV